MSSILVDYENVSSYGLIGADLLTPNDHLNIFYSGACNKIRKDQYELIIDSKCSFSAFRLVKNGKDFLDRYIAVRAGELYARGENEIAVVSKDNGYKAVIDSFVSMDYCGTRIICADSIENALVQFSDPEDKWRRSIIAARNQKVSLDEIVKTTDIKRAGSKIITNSLSDTEYECYTDQIIQFYNSYDCSSYKQLYIGLIQLLGRNVGLSVYRAIKANSIISEQSGQ